MKDKEWDPLAVKCFTTGSICEFEDGKARPHLGVVVSVEVGAKKGGAVYEVADAKDKKHKVYAKNMHAVYPSDPMTKPGTGPAEVLDDYLNVAGCTPTQLGIELELIELGWEVCAEDEASEELSQAAIMGEIDPSYLESPVQQYKAYRLLTSDLGKIFFKQLLPAAPTTTLRPSRSKSRLPRRWPTRRRRGARRRRLATTPAGRNGASFEQNLKIGRAHV